MKIINPYQSLTNRWLKGQLHIHTTNSDGEDTPYEVIKDYKKRGYDFIAFTDHNVIPKKEDLKNDNNIIVFSGIEYSDPHIGCIEVKKELERDLMVPENIYEAKKCCEFSIFNHPNWHIHHWPIFKMLKNCQLNALEIYNAVCEWLPGPAESSDKWDRLLSSGYRIFGVASDDAHKKEHRDFAWVMVNSKKRKTSILNALKKGCFYSSTGVYIKDIFLDKNILNVESENACEIIFIADRGSIRHKEKGKKASYEIRDEDIYVRVELFGKGRERAWLQPLFVNSKRSKELALEFRTWYLNQQKLISQW